MVCTLNIAGLGFHLESPVPLDLHPHYTPYLDESKDPDVIIRVLSGSPDYPAGEPVYNNGRLAVYPTANGWFREHRIWVWAEKHPDNPCLIPETDGSFSLRVPKQRLDILADRCEFLWMLAPEARLAEHRRMLLHAASVVLDGKAYLFFGPSGVGKSTHAAQWVETLGAVPLTGDRTVLEWTAQGSFVAHGSPFCGSSGLCLREKAPVGAVCLLNQAPENRMERLSSSRAFRELYAQTTINSWDSVQTGLLCDQIMALIGTFPVYRLDCRLGPEGAELCAAVLTKSASQQNA